MSTTSSSISERADALVSRINRGVDERIDRLKNFVEVKMNANLDAMISSGRAPYVRTSGDWVIKSRLTGREQRMEYSLGRTMFVLMHRKKFGGNPAGENAKNCGKEIEYIERTITEGSSSAGGTLIPQEWTDFVIPELGAKVVFLKSNPTVIPMQHQVMNIPGLTNNATYSWQGENAAITESAPTTNNTPLTLHTLKGLTGVSIEWLRDATPETDAALQANLVRGAARAADSGYFNGTGSSNQPTGLLNVSGINTAGAGGGATNGSTPTLDDISNQIYLLDAANAPDEGRTWFCHPRTVDRLRKIKNTLGDPILWTNPSNALDMRLNGYPIYTTTQLPINQSVGSSSTASTMLLVAMSDMYVGQGIRSQGLEVAISEEAAFSNAEILIRLLYRTDIQPGHVLSISALTGIL